MLYFIKADSVAGPRRHAEVSSTRNGNHDTLFSLGLLEPPFVTFYSSLEARWAGPRRLLARIGNGFNAKLTISKPPHSGQAIHHPRGCILICRPADAGLRSGEMTLKKRTRTHAARPGARNWLHWSVGLSLAVPTASTRQAAGEGTHHRALTACRRSGGTFKRP